MRMGDGMASYCYTTDRRAMFRPDFRAVQVLRSACSIPSGKDSPHGRGQGLAHARLTMLPTQPTGGTAQMEIVQRPELTVVGIEVVARFEGLSTAVPDAWRRLFDRRDELPPPPGGTFTEVSNELGGGAYRETVGLVAVDADDVPAGMSAVVVPAGRFVHHRHEGPVEQIADSFGAIYDWAAQHGLRLGPLKVDQGYTPDAFDGAHDLYIDVNP
ncbi:AraC family transcriptional regulator [Jiangella aurantiaca]|uniref:AraC family transcriptional regulator n=1 Tax=Jiangella aurantiaca TaxID=2530373 RepID=A0A4R5AET1_9ACTN|nr:AraC family transcriptional regulator [Jiangella aurantiaca]